MKDIEIETCIIIRLNIHTKLNLKKIKSSSTRKSIINAHVKGVPGLRWEDRMLNDVKRVESDADWRIPGRIRKYDMPYICHCGRKDRQLRRRIMKNNNDNN